jgi:phosphoenolpyruvate carboxylase
MRCPAGEVALRFYLTEVHELGAELSISGTLAPVTPRCRRWPSARPTTTCTARRTLPPRPDRHLRPPGRHAAAADRHRSAAPRRGAAGPYADAPTFLADLQVIERSLHSHHAQALVARGWRR